MQRKMFGCKRSVNEQLGILMAYSLFSADFCRSFFEVKLEMHRILEKEPNVNRSQCTTKLYWLDTVQPQLVGEYCLYGNPDPLYGVVG